MAILEKPKEHLEALQRFMDKGVDDGLAMANTDLNDDLVTICHGDCWTNNLFFKEDMTKVCICNCS